MRGRFRFTRWAVAALIIGCSISLFAGPQVKQNPQPQKAVQSQTQKPTQGQPQKAAQGQAQKETFTRPNPQGPTTPQMPTINRNQPDKIFLEQADSLFRNDLYEDIKIVKGDVKFRQAGTVLTCDSAYFYTDRDMADCFGNVVMTQGDTLRIYADKLYYNGVQRFARLRNGPTAPKVRLINRRDTLITDSLDYNINMRLGWYDNGGELRDPTTLLRSGYGEYSPATKDAEFFRNVVLINKKDHYTLRTDTLYYNTRTGIARIETRTLIEGDKDTIVTFGGTYNTKTGFADLTRRSIVHHRDSNNNLITLEGDSIIVDRATEISRAYRYRSPWKISQPVVLTDTANKAILIGGFGYYDNKKRQSMASEYPLLIEYSTQDTVFLRADTIRTYVMEKAEVKDSLGKVVEEAGEYYLAKAYNRGRFFRTDIQGVADSITYVGLDSMVYLHRKPVVWNEERQISGDVIEVHLNDSTADWVSLPQNGLLMEHVEEDFYNQLAARQMFATLEDGNLKKLEAEGNVMTIMIPQETDSTYNKFVTAESSFLDIDFADNDLERLKMWPDVDGTVSPIGMVKDEEKLMRGAVWLEGIRPIRRWYGDHVEWEDQLGEITDELEEYFSSSTPNTPFSTSTPVRKEAAADPGAAPGRRR